jgi:pseudouridine-5'-phosphate glycosidase
MVVAVPVPEADALDRASAEAEIGRAVAEAERAGVSGAALTPFLLGKLGEATSGRSLRANVSLLRQNARLAAQIASAIGA